MTRTPEEWLKFLAIQLDAEQPRYQRNRRYVEGKADLPEMGRNLRASWEQFQKKSLRNLGGLAKNSLADRIVPNGIRIGSDDKSEAVVEARRLWRDNGMDIIVADAVDDALTCGVGYLVVGLDDAGDVVVTREAPEVMYALPHPTRPWKARATIKVWRDDDSPVDQAKVVIPGHWYLWSRASKTSAGSWLQTAWAPGTWELAAEGEYDGDPTCAILSRKGRKGFIEGHHNLIDAINLGKLNRLVITAMQAFRQRALKKSKDAAELLDKDPDGNDIDYTKEFPPAPGALWDLPEGFDIWESQATDIRPLLEGEKTDARDFAAETQTPISVFIPDGANQSAEGAANAKEGQISQAKAETRRFSPAVAVAVVYALRALGIDLGGETVQILWTPPEHVSLSEKYSAAAQAKAAGISRRGIQKNILGMTPDEIEEEELNVAGEQLSAMTLIQASGTPAVA